MTVEQGHIREGQCSACPRVLGEWVCSEWTPALQAGIRRVRISYSPPKNRKYSNL